MDPEATRASLIQLSALYKYSETMTIAQEQVPSQWIRCGRVVGTKKCNVPFMIAIGFA